MIDAPARRLLVHEAMPGYEPRRFQPGAAADWPHVPAPDGSTADASVVPGFGETQAQEMAYLAELEDGWYAITNPARGVGFGLRFDRALFRYVWYWQQLGNVAQGYPWWGRVHTAALEPWTSYPTGGLNEAIANGTALVLAPGQEVATSLQAIAFERKTRVAGITPEGDVF
jgi:hypothetical protein